MQFLCPICHEKLIRIDRSAVCSNKHSFDYAKQGYLNLLVTGSKDHGDNKQMVDARTQFLSSDAYGFLKEELHRLTAEFQPDVLVDLGCGEGYYTEAMQAEEKYGFDLSKDALKHASRMDKSTNYCVSSIFHLPLPDSCADVVVTCFAPFAKDEVERILKPGGKFIFISPAPRHLFEMKEALYETPYLNVVDPLETTLKKESEYIIEHNFHADNTLLTPLFQMTPYAYKTGKRGIEVLHSIQEMDLTAQFAVRIYSKD